MIGDALVFKHKGLYDLGIEIFEQSHYTHVAVDLGDGRLIESYPGIGVRYRQIPDDPEMDRFRLPAEIKMNWTYALAVAATQVGKPYDVPGIIDVVVNCRLLPHEGWFCSELADAIYAWGGHQIDHGDVSYCLPSRFSQAPLIQIPSKVV